MDLTEPLIEVIAQRFRVLSEPMRIRLLNELRTEGRSIAQLCESTGSSQQNVSKHLTVLRGAGMVERTKQGNRAIYTIADPGVFGLCEQVCGGVRRQVDELDGMLRGSAG